LKIAYLAPYGDGTGYSKAAIGNILALDEAGLCVVPRPVKMTRTTGELPSRINELEQNDLSNVDFVVQHNLPSEFAYCGKAKNIGVFSYETNTLKYTGWYPNICSMDGIVVSCSHQKNVIDSDQVYNGKTSVIPFPVSVKSADKKIDFGLPKNTFVFYTIAEMSRRKNLEGLVAGYLSAFTSSDNVALIVKTHLPGRNADEALAQFDDLCKRIKSGLNIYGTDNRWPKIIATTKFMSDEDIAALHNSCHAFVSTSFGESFCIPAYEAVACGNKVLVPPHSSFIDMVYKFDNIKTFYDSFESVCIGQTGAPKNLYTGKENWYTVSTADVRKGLIEMFNEPREPVGKQDLSSLSFEAIGNQWKDFLENL
jgi:glycosyltransferase involved in cell wall biosynthesis